MAYPKTLNKPNSGIEEVLENFANISDKLLKLGIITTDSFTGEIGEYIACRLFNLKKTKRVNKSVDGVSQSGERYQVKSKVGSTVIYSITRLQPKDFDYLVVVYFDMLFNPIKVIRIPSSLIKSDTFRITSSNISNFEDIPLSDFSIPKEQLECITTFGEIYNKLMLCNIVRSRRIVGDIGEFYACEKLNLIMSTSLNEKGCDARHPNGLSFEIKTRRVYDSARRESETRRLNNLEGKSADYLIVVTLDRLFKCSGMWLIPMANIQNKKSANLYIVNKTPGTLNVVPSRIPYLTTGKKFTSFDELTKRTKSFNKTTIKRSNKKLTLEEELDFLEIEQFKVSKSRNQAYQQVIIPKKETLRHKKIDSDPKHDSTSALTKLLLFFLVLYIIWLMVQ